MKTTGGRTVHVRRQRPLAGGRFHGSTGFEPRVWKALQREAARFRVSIPFVLSVMAADTLGIELDPQDRFLIRDKPRPVLVFGEIPGRLEKKRAS